MGFLSEEEITGAAPQAAAKPTTAAFLSEEQITGTPPSETEALASQTPGAIALQAGKVAGVTLGKATAAAVDMILGIPAQLIGVGAGIGARAYGFGAGESRATQDLMSEAAQEQIPRDVAKSLGIAPELLTKPTQYLIEKFGGGEEFDQSIVAKTVDSVARSLEKRTGGVVTQQDAKDYFNTVMAAGGVVGVKSAVKAAKSYRAPTGEVNRAGYAELPPEEAAPAPAPKTPGPEAVDIVTAKQVKEIFAQAKKRGSPAARDIDAVKALFERALRPREEPAALPEEAITGEKPRITEPPIIGEAIPEPVAGALDSAFAKMQEGKRFDLDATELLALKAFERASPSLDAAGKRMRGNIDWKVAGATFGIGAVGLAAYSLWKKWEALKEQNQQLELENKSWRGLEEKRQQEGEKEQKPDQELAPKNRPIVTGALAAAGAFGAMRMAGAGIWAPKAIERLAAPLKEHAAMFEPKIKRYLDKEAGTPTDALKDVKIPFRDGMVRWEELTDRAFETTSIPERLRLLKEGKAMIGEPIWDLAATRKNRFEDRAGRSSSVENTAIQNYIAHARDYFNQNVPKSKWPQYDFVRLIKETADWDAREAKAAANSNAKLLGDSPVYKDYGDGMRWIQLNKPGQFAWNSERMGHSVRGYEPQKPQDISLDPIAPKTDWIPASGEGGHPSYGLGGWEAIKRGEAKILTLIDAKGEPHVTVEIYRKTHWRIGGKDGKTLEHVIRAAKQAGADWPADSAELGVIEQIKGKSNQYVAEKYLPYVQDLIRNNPKGGPAKWGHVQDLEGTGLFKHGDEFITHAEALPRAIKALEEHPRLHELVDPIGVRGPLVLDHLKTIQERGVGGEGTGFEATARWALGYEKSGFKDPKFSSFNDGITDQRGAADPKALLAIAALGGGAALGAIAADNKLEGAIFGALLGGVIGTGAGRMALRKAIESPDTAFGLSSTRVKNMSPELRMRWVKTEKDILQQIDRVHDQVTPFLQAVRALPKESQLVVKRALLNGETAVVESVPQLRAGYPGVTRALSAIEGQLKSLNRFQEGLVGYFPRMVKDLEGLKGAIGSVFAKGLDKALLAAESKMMRAEGRPMTDVERSLLVNRYLFKADETSFQPGYAKSRQIDRITPDLERFYEDPTESLLRYISGSINDINAAKFFGKDIVVRRQGGRTYTNFDDSIGNLTARLMREGKITNEQAQELRGILKARFQEGDKGMSTPLAVARNLTNTMLLGNVASAATQIGDSLATVYHHGAVPTIQAVAESLIGKRKITPKQLGLINHVAEELSEKGITGRALHNTMKWSGFHAIDMYAKGLNLNAGLIKNSKLAQTVKGRAELTRKYGGYFGNEMPALLDDLAARRMTENVETLGFAELSDAQPISKAEMPEAYLRNPNGRILYQLKTYMLKQADIVRRDAYQEIAKGTPKGIATGTKNLAALAAVYSLSNVPGDVVKDFLAGREIEVLTTPRLVENVLQTFGVNRYAAEKLRQGKLVDTAVGLMTPPLRVFEDIAKTTHSVLNEEHDYKGLSYVPLVGRPLYERYLGGNERKEIAETRLDNAGLPKRERKKLSPAAKAYLKQKRAERKAKELAR